MKKYLAAALILLAGTGAGWSQTVLPCSSTDPQADAAGACPQTGPTPNARNVLSQTEPTVVPGVILVNPAGRASIASPQMPRGMSPLIVPNDPLGVGVTNVNPFGGHSVGSTSGIGVGMHIR